MATARNAKPAQQRALAIGLALAVLGVVYLLAVHWWFTARHLEILQQMGTLKEQERNYRRIAAQRPELEKRLAEVRQFEAGNPAFLPEADVDAAAAGLTSRLNSVLASRRRDEQSCSIISKQPMKAPNKDLFERVSIRIRMKCSLEEFAPILHELEGGSPLLFTDEVQVWKQIGYKQPGSNQVASYLDIQFTLSGYLRKRAAKEGQ